MFNLKNFLKITLHTFFVIIFIFFSTLSAKSFDKYDKGRNISDYFSGVLLLNQSKYDDSSKFLKKLDGLENSHSIYASKYLYSLINSGNFNQAFYFSKKIEKEKKSIFESDLIIGIYYFKKGDFINSNRYFLKAKNRPYISILDSYLIKTLLLWTNLQNDKLENAQYKLNLIDNRFLNLRKIQNVFINCYFENSNTEKVFADLVSDTETDFSRYNFFYARYLISLGKNEFAKKIIKTSLKKYPRNLLLNQYKIDLENSKVNLHFDCKREKDVGAELLYIAANVLSSQSVYQLSNFYLNLAKYLNPRFYNFDTLLAENFYKIDDFSSAKIIYKNLKNYGTFFKWYADKQISRILILEEKKTEALKLLGKSFNELNSKGVYEIFDYAEFLKNNEEFENSIKYYSKILDQIDSGHPIYPKVKEGRGVAFERIGNWDQAEKDLLDSLKISPNQAYVINYLAYSWIEKGLNIKKSLEMLKKANKLKSNDPYIIDSLGWALFKLKRFEESKEYLQLAVRLMPEDPIVNDHFGDVLWKNGNEIQARYYWNYVLNLEKAEKDLKLKIEQKLTKGL